MASTHGYVLALRLGAAATAFGALFVAGFFEKVEFIPPEKAALEAAEAAAGDLHLDPVLDLQGEAAAVVRRPPTV